jgi:hypothetical protein
LALSEDPPNWYGPALENLQQGDLLIDFPVLLTTERPTGGWGLSRRHATMAILTQSCDLLKPRQDTILLVPLVTYSELKAQDSSVQASQYKKALLQGTAIAEFLLPPLENTNEWLVAMFRNVVSSPKKYVTDNMRSRVALESPYREHFAQGYARFVMRVGLPSGLQNCKLP